MPDPRKPGFDFEAIASEFDYRLPGGVTGRVPMPTMAEARKFRDSLVAAQRRVCGVPEDTPFNDETNEELQEALDKLTPEQRDQLNDEALEAVVEICKGSPSRDQITALPGPVQYAFSGWLQVELSPLF